MRVLRLSCAANSTDTCGYVMELIHWIRMQYSEISGVPMAQHHLTWFLGLQLVAYSA
jgi:hypothetical protein